VCWTLRQGVELTWQSWDAGEFLVYDSASGDTHLANEVTREVLQLLGRGPQRISDLGRLVTDSLGLAHDPDFEERLAELVAHLDRIGLVERVA
jgi:PqqD family protein of HPr-rel-A system